MQRFLSVFLISCFFASSVAASTTVDTSLEEHVYDLYVGGSSHSNINYTTNAASSSIVIDGTEVRVGVTAWADTANVSNDGISNDDTEVVQYSQLNAYSYNGDYGYGLVNSHSNDSHTFDNFTGGDDFDMVLFSFSEDVTLTGASFTFLQGYDTGKQISVIGLNDISLFENHASNEFTWSDVANSAGTVLSSGHFNISSTIYSGGSHGNFSSDFSNLSVAKYWLVGSYNTHFDDNSTSHHGSGFKLASIDFTVDDAPDITQPVPTTGSFWLLCSAICFVVLKRRKNAKLFK